MPTIVSICPYCRAGGVRAPQSNIGASATCPNCKSSFTVMPSDGLPGWAKEPRPSSSPGAPAPAKTPAVEETRPAAAMGLADVTEPSPLLPADELPAVKRPAPPPPPMTEMEGPSESSDVGLVVALGALILVGIAVVATQFPSGRLIAAAIAVLGLLGGLSTLGAEGRARLAGGLAIGLHGLILLVVLALPSWLNLEPWRGPPEQEAPQGPVALEHGANRIVPVQEMEWLDAARFSWEYKDVRVTVRSAHLGPVELIRPGGAKRTPRTQYLHLRLRVVNSGVERDIALSGWAVGRNVDAIRVVDPRGTVLKPAAFEEHWQPERGKPSERLFPDQSSEVHLIFAAPPGKVDWLRVELPGTAAGLSESIKFQIGSGFFTRPAAR